MTPPHTSRDTENIRYWHTAGRHNPWIRTATDPEFTVESFAKMDSLAACYDRMRDICWSIGTAFFVGDLCFIQQVNGGDEWLVLVGRDRPFESLSILNMGRSEFLDWCLDALAATREQRRNLEYGNRRERFQQAFTTAPVDYDSYGTVTVATSAVDDAELSAFAERRGKAARRVAIFQEYFGWHEGRYASGLHATEAV